MPALLERPKMTRVMYQSLKRHIMKEREKKKQEQEQDALLERLRKEKELRKKKEEEDSLTLEQTREQVLEMDKKLESVKQEKHELFSQLKRVLHQEDESRRKAQIREQNELRNLQTAAFTSGTIPGHHHGLMPQVHITGRPTLYKPSVPQIMASAVSVGMKRPRSPTPPPSSVYQTFTESKFPSSTYPPVKQQAFAIGEHKPSAYPQNQPTHVTYVTQPSHSFQQQGPTYSTSQSTTGKYNPASQSAFASYPSHYAHQQQKQITEPSYAPGFTIQRMPSGYLPSNHGSGISSLQQQLDRANQKSGFSEENFKIQQQQHIRGLTPQPGIIPPGIQLQQAPQSKGSIVTGYVPRSPAPSQPSSAYQPPSSQVSASYQAPSSQSSYPGQQTTVRPGYGGQQARSYLYG